MLKLYNTLTKKTEDFTPLNDNQARIYSCGPTVYNHAHIGNLSAYIFADTLRRIVQSAGHQTNHVMNFTDVDDKTIQGSLSRYPDKDSMEALIAFTRHYESVFLSDMSAIGNDVKNVTFVRATESIQLMQGLITNLMAEGVAYISDDGVYFNINEYQKSHTYGQLSHVQMGEDTQSRIDNDEYDKDSASDFALWKKQKDGEPAWKFIIDGQDMTGRPGWHIECSAMSTSQLDQPFDIHTGGIDLIFPHHENEIAQSTAGDQSNTYAAFFCHNEHIMVDGVKMSKSKNNFYTLTDITKKGIDPLAFRLLILQSHYRKPTNFSWENIQATQNRLQRWRSIASLRWQTVDPLYDDQSSLVDESIVTILKATQVAKDALQDDLNTPQALAVIEEAFSSIEKGALQTAQLQAFLQLLALIDDSLGLQLQESTPDITDQQKELINARSQARDEKDWAKSDQTRDELLTQNIAVRDTPAGTLWERI